MTRRKKILAITAAVLAVLVGGVLLFIGYFLPGIVKDIAIKQIYENTGRKMAIEKVIINPFGMTAEITEPEMKEADGKTTFVSFSSLRASVSMSSLWRRAIILDEVTLKSPYIHLQRLGANRYNFSDIQEHMEKRKKKEPEKKKEEAKFSINNISMHNGSVKFEDLAVSPAVSHVIKRMELRLPFISTLPYMVDKYVTPSFSALVNEAPFRVDGQLKPFKDSIEASVTFKLVDAQIPSYVSYVPGDVPVIFDSGKASADLVVIYTVYKHRKPHFGIGGTLSLTDFFLRDRLKEPIFALRKGEANIRRADVFGKVFDINSFDLLGFDIWLSRDKNGVWSHKRLTMPKKGETSPEEAAKEATGGEKVVVRVATTRVRDGKFHFADYMVPGSFKSDVTGISFDLGGYSTEKDVNAPFRIGLKTSHGEDVGAAGDLSSDPLAFNTNISLKGVKLQDYYPFMAQFITAPIKGNLDLFAHVDFDKQANRFKADNIGLDIRNAHVPFGKRDYAKLTSFRAIDGSFDMAQNRFNLAKLDVAGGDIRISKDRDGKITVNRLIKPQKRTGTSVKTTKKRGEKPFGYKVDAIALSRLDFTFRDDSLKTPKSPEFRLKGITAGVENVTGPKFSTMPYRLAAGYGKGGSVKTSGTVLPEPFKVTTHTVVGKIPIRDFEPYLSKKLDISFLDGLTYADVKANMAKKGEKMSGTFGGDLKVRSMRARGPLGNDILVWEEMRLDDIDGGISPLKLHIDEMVLNEYYVNLVIDRDGKLNFQKLVKREKPKEEKKPEKKEPPPDIKVNTITLQDGVFAFEDRHLQPRLYSTRFVKLGGRISGLNSEKGKRAGVDLRGALENISPLRVSGEVNPLSDPIYVNLTIDFDNIELPRLTPYSATYLGYRIDQGTLHTGLNYRIENNRIEATNRILIDQLFFGEKMPSDKATNLPVPTAVGLLKDKKGQIELEVPVTGRTDDPKFSFGDVVRQAFKGVFAKMFKNPFAFLGKGGEEFRNIYFPYGGIALDEPERRKLDGLAEKLQDRPGLKLDVMGYVDREKDPEPYRVHILNEKLRMEKYIDTLKGPKEAPQGGRIPENIRVEPGEYPKYLKRVYVRAEFPKPKDEKGRLKELPDEEMRKLLLAHTPAGEPQMRELSQERSKVVRDYLAKKGISQERLFLKLADVFAEPEDAVKSKARAEFGLAGVKGD